MAITADMSYRPAISADLEAKTGNGVVAALPPAALHTPGKNLCLLVTRATGKQHKDRENLVSPLTWLGEFLLERGVKKTVACGVWPKQRTTASSGAIHADKCNRFGYQDRSVSKLEILIKYRLNIGCVICDFVKLLRFCLRRISDYECLKKKSKNISKVWTVHSKISFQDFSLNWFLIS